MNALDSEEIVVEADARVVEVLELTSQSVVHVLISSLLVDRQLAAGSVERLPGSFASALVSTFESHLKHALFFRLTGCQACG